jgi:hypothetical protein
LTASTPRTMSPSRYKRCAPTSSVTASESPSTAQRPRHPRFAHDGLSSPPKPCRAISVLGFRAGTSDSQWRSVHRSAGPASGRLPRDHRRRKVVLRPDPDEGHDDSR